jgi:hypothetical protein
VRTKVLLRTVAAETLIIAAVFVAVSLDTPVPAYANRVPSCHPGQLTVAVRSMRKPAKPSTTWYGQVVYTNIGAKCEMARSTVLVIAETSSSASPRPLTKMYSLSAHGSPFAVLHEGGAHTWLEVTDTQPKNWTPIVCPATAISGLRVGGPAKRWPLKYFVISPTAGVCFAFIIKADTGSLMPGT